MTDRPQEGERDKGSRHKEEASRARQSVRRRASGGAGAGSGLQPGGVRPHGGHGDFGSTGAGTGTSRPDRPRGGTRGRPKKP